VRLLVNGEARDVPDALTVAGLVAEEAPGLAEGRGVAVAVDAEVVPRSAWEERKLEDGQHVEVLAAMQGGS
jgi:thiamine biosynthesis protein ThiS